MAQLAYTSGGPNTFGHIASPERKAGVPRLGITEFEYNNIAY